LAARRFPIERMPADMRVGEGVRIYLYLSPGVTGAYDMRSYPFYPYLSSYPVEANLLKRPWTTEDFTDFYMFHELLHWYLLDQPWLARWTPTLDRLYRRYLNDRAYSDIMSGATIVSAGQQTAGGDPYPTLPFNMYNFLGHIHVFALMRKTMSTEPGTFASVAERTKAFTGAVGDRYYALAVDVVSAMSDAELDATVGEIAQGTSVSAKPPP
jgi:hypothetical protein